MKKVLAADGVFVEHHGAVRIICEVGRLDSIQL